MERAVAKYPRLYLFPLMLIMLAAPVAAAQNREVLYQVSTIDALLAGMYDGWQSLGQLTKHGDFGIGTFDKLNGEMAVLDGKVYQIASDGNVKVMPASATTPFAAVTFFDRDKVFQITKQMMLTELQAYLDSVLPTKNLLYAIRIDGTFASLKTRSVPMQSKPYPPLTSVTAKQPTFEFSNVEGTLIALRCPYFVKGANVPGYHMHFLTSDRKRGGHLLDCVITRATVLVDVTPEFCLSLPNDEGFYSTDFQPATEESLKKAEQDRK